MDTVAAPEPIGSEAFVRATINILEETNSERDRLQLTHKALLNILVDSAGEREQLRDTQRAVLNMLEDFVTEQRRLEDTQRATLNILDDFEHVTAELRQANRELKHLDNLKSEFVAMASHELRTPLTSIAGFSSTMLSLWTTLPEKEKYKYVEIIDEQSRRLTRLIEGLLTLSKIESGVLKFNSASVIVKSAIEKAVEDLGAEHVDVECGVTLAVNVELDHLLQIIANYMTNAIKYGAAPYTIEAFPEGEAVRIRVSDQGAGVPNSFVPRLFERFAQADPDHSRSTDNVEGRGTGLGLSIVRALAEAHGGEAWYEPNTPTGSCFNVRLPAALRASDSRDGWS